MAMSDKLRGSFDCHDYIAVPVSPPRDYEMNTLNIIIIMNVKTNTTVTMRMTAKKTAVKTRTKNSSEDEHNIYSAYS